MSGGDVFAFLVLVAGVVTSFAILARLYESRLKLREVELQTRATLADDHAAQTREREALEARIRVLERIATDPAAQTAQAIERLRDPV